MAEIEIRNDDDIFRTLELAARDELPTDTAIKFIEWPKFEVRIKGEDFNGGVPTRIMPALLRAQKSVNQAYSRAVYGEVKRLSRQELRQTELIVLLEPGSTKFFADMAEIFNSISEKAMEKMSGTQIVITILGLAATASTAYIYSDYLNNSAKEKEIDFKINLSKQETERLSIITGIAENNNIINDQIGDLIETQNEILKRMDDKDQLYLNNRLISDGITSKKLLKKPRPERMHDRFDGTFVILSVESGQVEDGYRVKVEEVSTNQKLDVLIPAHTLAEEQISILQESEWGKHPLTLQMNIVRQGEKIVEATLIKAGLIDPGEGAE